MFLHSVAGLLHMGHALPQLALDAAAFFLAHLVEVVEQLFHLGQDRRFKRAIGRKRGRVQSAGHAQDRVQVGLGRQAELRRRRAKCLNVAAYDLAVEREALAAAALQIERQLHVAAGQFLFQQAAQFHFQRIAVRRHAEVHIEKAMVHRLQRQGEAHRVLARHADSRIGNLTLHLRETRSWNE